ncbi:sp110 nuclear body protein isoform X3 [Eumetopias jubatus]|uniref:sp110 nuclear body protein isoform X3 n=1 Tax=Eumetopias jubatus TaxID=34886 RepID=UPI001016C0A9|nr:sp110 nuclear body protein isoform X3 [Eumetopias jubatus]
MWQSTDFLFHPLPSPCCSLSLPGVIPGPAPGPGKGQEQVADPASRMFTMTSALEEALLQHFVYQKLEIAYAIYKPFPFLEGLRDSSFITETIYRESMEACRNQVPVPRVVYNILTHLEKTSNLSFLEMLFSRINLREYPNLMMILKGFRSVVNSYGGWNRAALTLLETPANPGGGRSLQTLLPLPPPQSHPPHAPSVTEPSASTQHSAEITGEPSSPSDPAVALPRTTQEGRITPEDSQEIPGTAPDTVQVITDDSPEPNDPKELQEASSIPPNKKGKKRKRSIWSTPKKRHQKKRLPKGRTSPRHRSQEKLQEVDQATQRKDDSPSKSNVMTSVQKASTECAQTSGPEETSDDSSAMNEEKRPQEPPSTPPSVLCDPTNNGNKPSLGKSPGEKRKRTEKYNLPSSKRRQENKLPRTSPRHRIQKKLHVVDQTTERKDDSTRNSKIMTRAQKARTECVQTSGPKEKKREKNVGPSSTRRCQKNILPKELRERKIHEGDRMKNEQHYTLLLSEKAKDETVDFLSPELPVTCGKAKGILYKEKLKQGSSEKCIRNEAGVWFTPKEFEIEGKRANTRKWKQSVHCRGKTLEELLKWENSKECEVCCRGGPLVCCDTCPRAFHEDCHIPSAEERSPWSCTFCKIKESSGRQQCHGESEVLERQMQPEEQLKCEFLLLKAYCHPQSSFFAETPPNIRDYGEPFKEAMWLDLVKERLTEKVYTVAWFVRDMRLIFRNHKTFYKASDFGQIGLDLEAEFEKDLKEVFIFCKAKENSFQTL